MMRMIKLDIDEIRDKNKTHGTIHLWLVKNYGKPTHCENELCKKTSTKLHWAKVKDKSYDFKRENFIMLCASCHYYYDERYKTRIINKRL